MNVALVGHRIDRVRNLTGFKTSHRVPDEVNDFTNAFVARITADQVDADLGNRYDALRNHFRFKRAQLQVAGPAEGRASIATPYFDYSVTVSLNAANPTQVIWRRQLSEIREPRQILTDASEQVFGSMFNTVELAPMQTIDLATFIDRLEDLDSQRITLAYDKEAGWCRISLVEIVGEIELTAQTLSLRQRNPKSPGHLMQSFLDFQTALIELYDIELIGFDAKP